MHREQIEIAFACTIMAIGITVMIAFDEKSIRILGGILVIFSIIAGILTYITTRNKEKGESAQKLLAYENRQSLIKLLKGVILSLDRMGDNLNILIN